MRLLNRPAGGAPRSNTIRYLAASLVALFSAGVLVIGSSRWERDRLLDTAEESLETNDPAKAAIYLNAAYELDPENERTLALLIELFEQSSHPVVMHWDEKLLSKSPESVPVRLRAAKHAMSFQKPDAALRVLSTMPESGETAEYSRLMAAASGSAGLAPGEIRKHLQVATQNQPGNEFDQLNLAIVDAFTSRPDGSERRAAIARLEEIASGDGAGVAWALLALIQLETPTTPGADADPSPHLKRLTALVDEGTHLRFSLLALDAAHSQGGDHWKEMLLRVRAHADRRSEPQPTFWTMDWMNRHGLSEESIAWSGKAPTADKCQEFPASLALAEAYIGARRWTDLSEFLENQSWAGMEPLRLGMKAIALQKSAERSGQKQIADITRRQALKHASRSEAGLSLLESAARKHGWGDLREEVLWEIARARNVSPKTALSACARLKRRYLAAGDLAKCHAVAQRSVEIMPTDFIETNNLIYTSLLIGDDRESLLARAQALHKRYPGVRPILSTYALAHYFAGDYDQASKLINELPQPFREHPSIAPFCGIILAHAGDLQGAGAYLERASTLHFEEEKKLVAAAKGLIANPDRLYE